MSKELQIRQMVSEKLEIPLERVTLEADLIVDLGGDSLTLAELTAEIEQKTGLRIPMDRLWDIVTVGDMKQVLEELDAEGSSG